jgi:predicted lipoprotein with Yx(FWY)xxD motif
MKSRPTVQDIRALLVKSAILVCVGLGALALGMVARGGGPAGDADAATARPTVKVAYNKTLKKTILVDARGITLYAFYYDESGKPTCYVDPGYRCVKAWPSCVDDAEYHCSKLWPPLRTIGRPRAGRGVNAQLLRVARRRDGHLQVTYNHFPLYYYAGGLGPPADTKPGDANGQGFGGLWWVVSPKGLEIK